MGQILSTSGSSPEDAEKALRRAMLHSPQRPETWINLVRHLVSIGRLTDAKTEIDEAAKALPAATKDLTLASCYELMSFLVDAAEHHNAAVAKNPNSAPVHRAAAYFCMRVAHFNTAEVLYRKVHEQKMPATDEDLTAARRSLRWPSSSKICR